MTAISLDPTGGAVVDDMPHDEYLRHPALSASGAKLLVQPGGPAKYQHRLTHPEPPKKAFDHGHAAHAAVLGVGPTIVVVDAPDWRTKKAQQERDEARAAGRVPLLFGDAERVHDMAAALRQHPLAARLLNPAGGRPEVSLFWHDEQHGVDRRCRVDWLRQPDQNGRLILVDYKTCSAADVGTLRNTVVRYGYHQQAVWYRDLIVGLGLARTAPFLFVFQETSAPYLVHLVELDDQLLQMGEERNERALRLFADCTAAGVWPGYNDGGITLLQPPRWALYDHDEMLGQVEE